MAKCNLQVFVPLCDNEGSPLGSGILDHVSAEFCRIGGGSTTTYADGAWVNDAGKVIYDDVCIVETDAEGEPETLLGALQLLAQHVKREARQSAVYYRFRELAPTDVAGVV